MAGEQPARPGCGATAARRPVRDRVARRVPPRPAPAALRLVGPAGVAGRALDHAGTIDAGLSGRERHPLPRLQHMFEHLQLPRAGRACLGAGRRLRGPATARTRGRMQTVNHRSRMRPLDADRAAAGRNRSWRVSAACSGQARGQKEATGLSDAAGHVPKARLSAQLGKIAGDATQIRRYLQPRPARLAYRQRRTVIDQGRSSRPAGACRPPLTPSARAMMAQHGQAMPGRPPEPGESPSPRADLRAMRQLSRPPRATKESLSPSSGGPSGRPRSFVSAEDHRAALAAPVRPSPAYTGANGMPAPRRHSGTADTCDHDSQWLSRARRSPGQGMIIERASLAPDCSVLPSGQASISVMSASVGRDDSRGRRVRH
jgi:hypothetical protein